MDFEWVFSSFPFLERRLSFPEKERKEPEDDSFESNGKVKLERNDSL